MPLVAVVTSLALAACSDSLVVSPTGSTTNSPEISAPGATATTVTTSTATASTATTTSVTPAQPTPAQPVESETQRIDWVELEPGIEEASFGVPIDHDDPDGEQIELYLVRHLAADPSARIGTLFVNPGGPGFGASDLALQADFIYGAALLDAFDIIGIDPRGTGRSGPTVDCVDDYDPYFSIETGPDDATEDAALQAIASDFAQRCIERSGDVFAHITTVASATDVDLVRQALGEETVSWFGWSYGTELGATWATLFPETVRAAVLDGAVDPTVGRVDELVQQAAGFDSALTAFLADCSADTSCAFHNGGDAEGAFLDLLVAVETTRIPTLDGRPPLNQGIFETGVIEAMYDDSSWPSLAEALTDAADGDGAAMIGLNDRYYGRRSDGSYGDELEAYFAIVCADDPAAPAPAGAAVDEAVAVRRDFYLTAPRISTAIAYEVLICASLAAAGSGGGTPLDVTGEGAGPIVVVGNTGDPATPFEGSRRMADTLDDAIFVAVEANRHTAYGLNACIDRTIDEFLVDLELPDRGLTC